MRAKAVIIICGLLGAWAGCGSKGGSGGNDLGAATYAASTCGTCVQGQCSAEIMACGTDSGCAAWFACVGACRTGAGGDADPACETACAPPTTSTGLAAQSRLIGCRTRGAGAALCPACGHAPPEDGGVSTNPILNQQCPASTDPTACGKCEDTHCCNTYAACHNDPACQALADCEKACANGSTGAARDTCFADCEQKAPKSAVQGYATRLACLFVYCVADCSQPNACVQCQTTQCLDPFLACNTDADCYLISKCAARCATGDGACIGNCSAMYPAGTSKFNDQAVCGFARCASDCQ